MDSLGGLDLVPKVRNKTATVCVIGLGYVGLPLALAFAHAGYRTIGVDSEKSKVEEINRGHDYLNDQFVRSKLPELVKSGRFAASSELVSSVQASDFIVICLPTPLDKSKRPDLSIMKSALAKISRVLSPGKLIVIESSVYPGFTEGMARELLERSGQKAGVDFGLAYSPERIDFANPKYYVANINKVVGGINKYCTEVTAQLYGNALTAGITKVSSPSVAEASKMVENLYRFVNISLVNELAVLFEKIGIDTYEVIRAAATKPFGYMPHFPGPGIGGHCIPKDPYYLSFRAKQEHVKLKLLAASALVDAEMAFHVGKGVELALRKVGKKLYRSKIAVLGLTYKAETNEVRRSPAVGVLRELSKSGATIRAYDPYAQEIAVGKVTFCSEKSVEEALSKSDCCIFLVNHKSLLSLDPEKIKKNMNPPPLVYDARGLFNGRELAQKGIFYAGLGKPSFAPTLA